MTLARTGFIPIPPGREPGFDYVDIYHGDSGAVHLYVAIGDPGGIAVVDTRSLRMIESVPTEPGAHTLGIDPDRHAVHVFLPACGGAAVYEDR